MHIGYDHTIGTARLRDERARGRTPSSRRLPGTLRSNKNSVTGPPGSESQPTKVAPDRAEDRRPGRSPLKRMAESERAKELLDAIQ